MMANGFKINECDKCVYIKGTNQEYIIVCLYVDDMLILGSNIKIIKSTKDILSRCFEMQDMGVADVILGIKIIRTSEGLTQSHYVEKILQRFCKEDINQAKTPMDFKVTLEQNLDEGI